MSLPSIAALSGEADTFFSNAKDNLALLQASEGVLTSVKVLLNSWGSGLMAKEIPLPSAVYVMIPPQTIKQVCIAPCQELIMAILTCDGRLFLLDDGIVNIANNIASIAAFDDSGRYLTVLEETNRIGLFDLD